MYASRSRHLKFYNSLAGFMRDITGTYDYSFYAGSGSSFLAGLLLLVTLYFTRHIAPTGETHAKDIQANRQTRRRSSILPWKRTVLFVK